MAILPTQTTDYSNLSSLISSSGFADSSVLSTVSNNYSSANPVSSITNSLSSEITDVIGVKRTTDLRIKLIPKNKTTVLGSSTSTNPLSPIIATGGMIFPYTPTITVQGNANYSTQTPIHSNQDYKIYQNTPSMTFNITGEISANSLSQAQYSAAILHFFRVVTKSRFGESSDSGLPPPLLYLNGYGSFMFNMLPVIVNSYSYSLPNNVDYIDVTVGSTTAKIPTLTTLSVSVTVQNIPSKLNTFDIDKFANGTLVKAGGWF